MYIYHRTFHSCQAPSVSVQSATVRIGSVIPCEFATMHLCFLFLFCFSYFGISEFSSFFSFFLRLVNYTMFIKNIAYESVERHGVKPRSLTPGLRPLGICRLQEFEWTAFSRLAKMLNFLIERHSQALWFQQSLSAVDSRSRVARVSRWRPGHLYSATCLVAWVTRLCSVHWSIVNMSFLVQWWLAYEFWFINGLLDKIGQIILAHKFWSLDR
jgi:hypothetical protein